MRIIQLIDSLDAGGAEKMAVNYANSLAKEIEFSGLVATRREGVLRSQVNKDVAYLCLEKKKAIDLKAIFKLRNFCTTNHVQFIHAHGTSFFTGVLLKVFLPRIKLIWHDHNGDRDAQHKYSNKVLWCSSNFFRGVIVVNQKLKRWMNTELKSKNVIYLPNYTIADDTLIAETQLNGTPGKRILHLANLRNPKNHLLLIEVAAKVQKSHPEWTFHLVGKDNDDSYSDKLKATIKSLNLCKTVYIYGQKNDIGNIITQAAICVLASTYEGLPVALLEYGIHGKPVVVTDVGEMPMIVNNKENGFVVPSDDVTAFYTAVMLLMDSTELRDRLGAALAETIAKDHAENAVIANYLSWLKNLEISKA